MRESKDKYLEAYDQLERRLAIIDSDDDHLQRTVNFQMEMLHKITKQRDAWIEVAHQLREHGTCFMCETFLSKHECEWQKAVADYDKLYAESDYAHEVHDG